MSRLPQVNVRVVRDLGTVLLSVAMIWQFLSGFSQIIKEICLSTTWCIIMIVSFFIGIRSLTIFLCLVNIIHHTVIIPCSRGSTV